MLTREEAYDIICDLNEEAHSATYDDWEDAMSIEDDEEREEALADASYQQSIEFREAFQTLDHESQEAVLHYAKYDENFAEEFNQWWGEE